MFKCCLEENDTIPKRLSMFATFTIYNFVKIVKIKHCKNKAMSSKQLCHVRNVLFGK